MAIGHLLFGSKGLGGASGHGPIASGKKKEAQPTVSTKKKGNLGHGPTASGKKKEAKTEGPKLDTRDIQARGCSFSFMV